MKIPARLVTPVVIVLRVVVTIALVYIIARTWEQVAGDAREINWGLLLLSALLYPVSFALIMIVWHFIMRLQTGSNSWQRDGFVYCYSNLVRNLPLGFFFRIAGRVVSYDADNISRSATVTASLWEVVLHMIPAVLLLMVALLLRPVAVGEWFWILALVIVLIVGGVLVRRLWAQLKLSDPRAALDGLGQLVRAHGQTLALILVLNGITWLVAGAMLLLQVYAVDSQAHFDYLNALQIWLISGLFGYVALLLPFLDYGAKEATMAVLLSPFMPSGIAVVISILYRLTFTISDVVWSLVGLLVVKSPVAPAEGASALAAAAGEER